MVEYLIILLKIQYDKENKKMSRKIGIGKKHRKKTYIPFGEVPIGVVETQNSILYRQSPASQ